MSENVNVNREKKLLIGLGVTALILLGKLFYIQIIDDKYKRSASNNSMYYEVITPPRGIIYDRNGKIIVGNSVAYDILVSPREVEKFDTLTLADAPKEAVFTSMMEDDEEKAPFDGNKLTLWGKGDVTVADAADIAADDFIVHDNHGFFGGDIDEELKIGFASGHGCAGCAARDQAGKTDAG